jgi:hypothetical protein
LPRFKYDKSKAKNYQLALITSIRNMWVVDLIGHLGADELTNLLQQCVGVATKSTFDNKPSGRRCKKDITINLGLTLTVVQRNVS